MTRESWTRYESLCAPRAKIVYVPTPKVACTTVKTALVDIEAAGFEVDRRSGTRSSALSVHHRGTHSLGCLGDLSPGALDEAMTGVDWIRFCLTRRPYERLASAWIEKIFLGANFGLNSNQLSTSLVESIDRTAEIGGLFREFVRGLVGEFHAILDDPHFTPQSELLDTENFAYTHVVDLKGLEEFAGWIRTSDESRSRFELGTPKNKSMKFPLRAMYDRPTAERVEALYARDFECLGYAHETFDDKAQAFELNSNELAMVERIVELNAKSRDLDPYEWIRLSNQRTGGRYGAGEVRKALMIRLRRIVNLDNSRSVSSEQVALEDSGSGDPIVSDLKTR